MTKEELREGIALRYRWDALKQMENLLLQRMLFIAQKVSIRTSDTMISLTPANKLNAICDDVEVEPGPNFARCMKHLRLELPQMTLQ